VRLAVAGAGGTFAEALAPRLARAYAAYRAVAVERAGAAALAASEALEGLGWAHDRGLEAGDSGVVVDYVRRDRSRGAAPHDPALEGSVGFLLAPRRGGEARFLETLLAARGWSVATLATDEWPADAADRTAYLKRRLAEFDERWLL